MKLSAKAPYKRHLRSSNDLETTYEATRAGFVFLALEKNRRAVPYVEEARALQVAAHEAKEPADLLQLKGIESGLLTAAGVSDKAVDHLTVEDAAEAVKNLITNFLEPAGMKFVEELVFRFLLIRGDTLGGSMRNVGGALAQRKLTRAVLSALTIAGVPCRWQNNGSREWTPLAEDNAGIEFTLRGLNWQAQNGHRTLIYNLNVPLVNNNIDMCLFSRTPEELKSQGFGDATSYVSLGELKGGIDPAGADEHWKTAQAALERIRSGFAKAGVTPCIFFIAAAVEKKMATEIWSHLENGSLSNAANLNDENQIVSISNWLCSL